MQVDAVCKGKGQEGQSQAQGQRNQGHEHEPRRQAIVFLLRSGRAHEGGCQKRNSDMASVLRKKGGAAAVTSAIVDSFGFDLLVDIKRGACGADHAPDDR